MKASSIYSLSSIFVLATAVDISGYAGNGCQGASLQCSNVGEAACCTVIQADQSRSPSGGFTNVGPASLFGFQPSSDGNPCGEILTYSDDNSEGGFFCITADYDAYPGSGPGYTGLSYQTGSSSRKRDSFKCTSSVEPDTLFLEDGTKYNLTAMAREEKQELWDQAANGATKKSLSKKFLGHRL